MSSLLSGVIAAQREEAGAHQSTTTEPPRVGTYIDSLAALVPAEVLALHAVIVGWCTTTVAERVAGGTTTATHTVISHVTTLRWAFVALLLLGPALFLAGRQVGKTTNSRSANRWRTLVQALIPAAAFVAWTMLGQTTAFDAVAPGLITAARDTIAVFAAVLLGVLASHLGYKLNQEPSTRPVQAPARDQDAPADLYPVGAAS